MSRYRNVIFTILTIIIVAFLVFLLKDNYRLLSIIIAIITLLPFFIQFEKRRNSTQELVIIAVMTSLSVIGRLVFAPIPAFKPVTAIVIITALCLGSQAGFATGSLSALVSNMFFGQGVWTPIQMLAWGLLGFFVGIFKIKERINYPLVVIFGIIGGVFYSVIMEIFTTITYGTFDIKFFLSLILTSLPFMIVYMVSNVIFLIFLIKPFSKKLLRIRQKFRVF